MPSVRHLIPKRFSLRALLLCLSFIGLLLGWTKFERERIARRRNIIADIRDAGGKAFDRQTARSLGFDFPGAEPEKPHWLQRLLLSETVQDRPQWVILSGSSITDQDLVPLHELRTLRQLTLRHTKVTDAGVATLKKSLPQCKVHRDSMSSSPTK